METICANCGNKLNRKPCRIKERNYCNGKCQMQYEYKQGIRDKNDIIKKAQEAIKRKSLEKFKTNPTKYLSKRGYMMIYIPGKGNIKEHHYVFCEYYNIDKVPKGFVIHHINFNKLDNSIENLKLMEKGEHNSLHTKITNEQNKEKFRQYAINRKRDSKGRFL
jgi:hypothetical protein